MERLQRILSRLQDVNYVKSIQDTDREAVVLPEEQQMQPMLPAKNPADVAIKPEALDSLAGSMYRDQKDNLTPADPNTDQESPVRKKLRYLDMMNKNQQQKFPSLRPMQTLAGGGYSGS